MEKIDDTFLNYACDVLAETNRGLSGMQIVHIHLKRKIKELP